VGPAVPLRRQRVDTAVGDREDAQPPVAGIGWGVTPADADRDLRAVGGQARRVEVEVRIVGQRAAFTGGHVDRHHGVPLRTACLRHRPGRHDGPAVRRDVPVAVLVQCAADVAGDVPRLTVVLDDEQAGPVRPQIVVPVPDRELLVQDRGDAGVLPSRAEFLVSGRIRRGGQHRRAEHDRPGRADGDPAHAAGWSRHHPGVTTAGGLCPQ
jgi:hypothetical protein